MKVLVTGAAGFTGRRMMDFLAVQERVVPVGLVRKESPETSGPAGSLIASDLLDPERLQTGITRVCPDAVIHLAGLTRGTPEALHAANVDGTRHLLDAVVRSNPACRILVVSSSAVYGYAGDLPIPVTSPLNPVADYGRSKVEQELVAFDYAYSSGDVAIARPFNLAGPGQTDAFVCGRIVNQIVGIERGERDALDLWEISSSRDLIDVRDVVKGYWALISCTDYSRECAGKAFNLGSGIAYKVSEIITIIEKITGRHYTIHLPESPPVIPIPTQRSDNARITGLTGWKPETPLRDTLRDMLDAERKKK